MRKWKIPFLDVRAGYLDLRKELDAAYQRVMQSGQYILGEEVEQFEKEFAAYCGTRFGIGVGNGLDALFLALRAYGVGVGDEVIVPSNTYIATWLAVTRTGATVVPVEPNIGTYNIDYERIEQAITPRTKAIVPVHLYGLPADMEPILEIAQRRGLVVIADAAQAHGAKYKGKNVGAMGHAVAYSFYPTKNLGAFGDGGAVVTNDAKVAQRIRMLRNYGSLRKYYHEVQGVNSRLDPLQAAFLRVKLSRLDVWNARRRRWAKKLLEELRDSCVSLPVLPLYSEHVWHLFVVRVYHRSSFQAFFAQHGIATLIHYPVPPHLSGAYRGIWDEGSFPVAEKLAREVVSLPISPHMQESDVEYIVNVIRMWCEQHD